MAAGFSLNWTETRRFFGLNRRAILDCFNLTKHTGASRNGESSMDTSSTTMPLTLNKRLNMFFIRRFLWFFFLIEKQTYRKRPSHPHNQRLNDETTPTKTTQEPQIFAKPFPRKHPQSLNTNPACLNFQHQSTHGLTLHPN